MSEEGPYYPQDGAYGDDADIEDTKEPPRQFQIEPGVNPARELEALIWSASDTQLTVQNQGPEHTDIKKVPRGHFALLAWGPHTYPDAILLVWLWNHRHEILATLKEKVGK